MKKDIRAFYFPPTLLYPSLIDKMSSFRQGFSVNILSQQRKKRRRQKIVNCDEVDPKEKAPCCWYLLGDSDGG